MSTELDWEEMVNRVCVAGRPDQIGGLAEQWQAVFRNAGTVSASLRDGMKDLEKTWTGPASDDYRKKILAIADAIDQFETDNKPVVDTLQTAQAALKTAQDGMPVPDYMLNEVQNRRDKLDKANDAGARALIGEAGAIPTFGLSFVAASFLPDSFVKPLADSFVGKWGREFFGQFTAMWDDFNGEMTAQARTYYDGVDSSFQQADLVLASPTPAVRSAYTNSTPPDYSTGNPGRGISAPPTPGVDSGFDPATANPSLNAGSAPGLGDGTGTGGPRFGDPSAGDFGSGAFDPSAGGSGVGGGGGLKDPSTGLAGAGGPFTGAGGLGGGMSGAGSGLGGAAGLGSGGLGSVAGRPVSTAGLLNGAGLGGLGGGGLGAGAGGNRAGRAAGKAGAGAPGGSHAGGHAPDDEHGTWLIEDDDPWGGDSAAPPGVLGA